MSTRAENTLLAWQVLVSCAANRQTITYGNLAAAIGQPGGLQGVGRNYLNPISKYCSDNDMPDLTASIRSTRSRF